MEINLEPKQALAFHSGATEVLYGGAKGGGKSFLLRTSALRWCLGVPGIQVYLFRRTLADLRRNHMEGPSSFGAMLADHLRSGHVKYHAQNNQYVFWNNANLNLCYCESERDVENYQGAEIHVLMPDETTHYTDYQYRYLRAQVRLAGLKVPEEYKGRLPRIEAASNPGSVGHAWVKRTWISPKPAMEVWRAEKEEGGMLRQFIPAKLSDNPYLTRDDPDYADRISGMGSASLVRAMLDGDWDIVAGQAFEKLSRTVHCIAPFTPPADWLCFGSLDWGSSRPFSFGLWTVSNGDALPDGRVYRRGAIIRWKEWYGFTGKPNEGLRMEVAEVAKGIKERCGDRKLAYIAADPSMWKVDGGPSHAETMGRYGVILRRADHSRLAGYLEVRNRIAGDAEGPMLYATSNCHDGFWRTMPDLVMDEAHTEDVDTEQEDHCFAAGTLVLTRDGPRPIEKCGGATVMTAEGWRTSYLVPPRNATCVKLTYDDGSTVTCTPEHRFLTGRGWISAIDLLDEVSYNALCESRSLAKHARSFTAFVTGFAGSIFSARGLACTAQYGGTSTGPSPKVSTSTTSTEIAPITKSKICNWLTKNNTYRTTQKDKTIVHGQRPCERAHDAGMVRQKAGNGTGNRLGNTWLRPILKKWRSLASNAALFLWQVGLSRTALCFAALTAAQRRCVNVGPAGNQEVFCLHVPVVNNFCLSDGSVVHNCYDDARYACMSRPWMRAVEREVKRERDWRGFREKDEATWRTA